MRRCSSCGMEKSHEEFSRRGRDSDKLMRKCRPCRTEAARAWNLANPERHKAHQRKWAKANPGDLAERNRLLHLRRYGLTQETWDAMFEAQGRACGVCGVSEPVGRKGWVIDHDHACCDWLASSKPVCGKCVRGILCNPCNAALGMAKDDKEILLAMIRYLEKSC